MENNLRHFWTIQPAAVYEHMKVASPVYVDPDRLPYGGYIPECYQKLATHLETTSSCFTGKLPWWLYSEKPDLRYYRHTRPWGEKEVRIELALPENRYFEFSLKRWNRVRSGRASVEVLSRRMYRSPNDELIAVTESLAVCDVKKIRFFVGTNKLFRLIQDRRKGLELELSLARV